jgi:hypothetical protein
MFAFLMFPGIGTCVSNGVFGIYDLDGNGAGLVAARNAGSPVAVGPFKG